jgi:hypothetical protein
MKGRGGQRVVVNLIIVNALAVLLDAALLTTEYTNHFDVQTTFKPVAYSIKLMLEFTVLNSLLVVIRTNPSVIQDVEQLHDDLHMGSRCGGKHPDNTAAFVIDPERSDQSDRGFRISPVRSHSSWVSLDPHARSA